MTDGGSSELIPKAVHRICYYMIEKPSENEVKNSLPIGYPKGDSLGVIWDCQPYVSSFVKVS